MVQVLSCKGTGDHPNSGPRSTLDGVGVPGNQIPTETTTDDADDGITMTDDDDK
jgi:hypothetical protein